MTCKTTDHWQDVSKAESNNFNIKRQEVEKKSN